MCVGAGRVQEAVGTARSLTCTSLAIAFISRETGAEEAAHCVRAPCEDVARAVLAFILI